MISGLVVRNIQIIIHQIQFTVSLAAYAKIYAKIIYTYSVPREHFKQWPLLTAIFIDTDLFSATGFKRILSFCRQYTVKLFVSNHEWGDQPRALCYWRRTGSLERLTGIRFTIQRLWMGFQWWNSILSLWLGQRFLSFCLKKSRSNRLLSAQRIDF